MLLRNIDFPESKEFRKIHLKIQVVAVVSHINSDHRSKY
jgi:hypothetical protein